MRYCTQAEDFQDARAVARVLGIPLHRANFAAEYRSRVFEYFLAEHRAGRTPNPDVLCNREVKFGVALQHARRLGASQFATGHYARLRAGGRACSCSRRWMRRRIRPTSCMPCTLPICRRPACRWVITPRRRCASAPARRGLPVFDKPDSTGICFIGERPFRDFLRQYLNETPGPIESADGEALGTHCGLAFYTSASAAAWAWAAAVIARRRPGTSPAKDVARNVLIAVQGHDHPLLCARELTCENLHWLVGAARPVRGAARCACAIAIPTSPPCSTPGANGTARVIFDEPQRALTPGQFAVAYDGERCLGGGTISAASGRTRS